jgi:hypothetical protein
VGENGVSVVEGILERPASEHKALSERRETMSVVNALQKISVLTDASYEKLSVATESGQNPSSGAAMSSVLPTALPFDEHVPSKASSQLIERGDGTVEIREIWPQSTHDDVTCGNSTKSETRATSSVAVSTSKAYPGTQLAGSEPDFAAAMARLRMLEENEENHEKRLRLECAAHEGTKKPKQGTIPADMTFNDLSKILIGTANEGIATARGVVAQGTETCAEFHETKTRKMNIEEAVVGSVLQLAPVKADEKRRSKAGGGNEGVQERADLTPTESVQTARGRRFLAVKTPKNAATFSDDGTVGSMHLALFSDDPEIRATAQSAAAASLDTSMSCAKLLAAPRVVASEGSMPTTTACAHLTEPTSHDNVGCCSRPHIYERTVGSLTFNVVPPTGDVSATAPGSHPTLTSSRPGSGTKSLIWRMGEKKAARKKKISLSSDANDHLFFQAKAAAMGDANPTPPIPASTLVGTAACKRRVSKFKARQMAARAPRKVLRSNSAVEKNSSAKM